MAYVLGFWFADGYMRHEKSYRVVFSSKDVEHLEDIRTLISSTHKLVTHGESKDLIIFSKKLFNSLKKLGGIRKKSLVMKFPKIPDVYLADFIRGYFDGDGSVHLVSYIRTKDKKKQIDLRCNFTSGSPNFLNTLRDILSKKLNLSPRKICSYGDGNQWKLGYGTKDTKLLLKFMYYPKHTISLSRKADYLKYC